MTIKALAVSEGLFVCDPGASQLLGLRQDEKGGVMCEFAAKRQGEHHEPGPREIPVREFTCGRVRPGWTPAALPFQLSYTTT